MNTDPFDGRFLGVLGGMGPMAGAVFVERLTALTPTKTEQQHVPVILWSDPRVPDRPAGHAGSGEDPLLWMRNGVRHLVDAGARAIAIPCNTAHLWYDQIAAGVAPVPVLHIVDAVVADLHRQGVHKGCIGVLGTAPTLRLGLYQQALERQGYTIIAPDDNGIARYCTEPIRLVKDNRQVDALAPAVDGVASLRRQGADAIVLGCTELPLAIPLAVRNTLGVVVSDSIDALALAALDWYYDQ